MATVDDLRRIADRLPGREERARRAVRRGSREGAALERWSAAEDVRVVPAGGGEIAEEPAPPAA